MFSGPGWTAGAGHSRTWHAVSRRPVKHHVPSSGHACWPQRGGLAPSEILPGFGGTTEIQKEIIGRSLGL